MALNATTLSGAIGATDTSFGVASATGISAPAFPVGPFSLLLVEQELMFVTGITGTLVSVQRSWGGSKAVSHGASGPVLSILSSAFSSGRYAAPAIAPPITPAIPAPLTGATVTPTAWGSGTLTHFPGTTALVTISLPTGVLATELTMVFDGSGSGLTWTNAGNINVAGTSTTAGSAVTFRYDASISKWVPSRL